MKSTTKFTMPQRTRHRVNLLLQDVLCPADVDGLYAYAPGWSDIRVADKIASETGEPVRAAHVRVQRQGVFGRLYDTSKAKPAKEEVSAAKRLADAEARMAELERKVALLCKELGYAPPPVQLKLRLVEP